jgi:hypothetical protein
MAEGESRQDEDGGEHRIGEPALAPSAIREQQRDEGGDRPEADAAQR